MRLSSVGHSYDRTDVFDDVTLAFPPGRVGLIGVNGAGKTTLLRLLATTLEPSRGEVCFPGLGGLPVAARRHIGFMPQSLALPRSLRVLDFLAYVAWLKEIPRSERADECARVLELADLESHHRSTVGRLSGGMHRRLLFAQAMIGRPRVLLLDEPTAGLDPEQRIRLRERLRSADGVEVLLVSSHLIEDLVPVVERIVMLDDHRIAFDGSVEGLRELGVQHAAVEGMSAYEAAFLRLQKSRT
ncbi:ATP-binding cassette domain-containing protein [Nocardioides immobilis]|uniref:ATP-binding cassette domain-containing protein n=1 Tax=Nocardioides immobilis TaxID=2049295 RepID=UPI0015F87DB8|nr:ATP-binding cassette domain-containing protein [Nocardioides immobilis]